MEVELSFLGVIPFTFDLILIRFGQIKSKSYVTFGLGSLTFILSDWNGLAADGLLSKMLGDWVISLFDCYDS